MTFAALLLELIDALFGKFAAPVATKVIEDSVSGALQRPAPTVTQGYFDAGVVAQVRQEIADPTGVEPP